MLYGFCSISDLFEGQNGLINLLKDECLLAKPRVQNYTRNIYIHRGNDTALDTSNRKNSKSENNFTVVHFARSVQYCTVRACIFFSLLELNLNDPLYNCFVKEKFIEKNNDSIPKAVVELFEKIIVHHPLQFGKTGKTNVQSSCQIVTLKKELDILIKELKDNVRIH